MIISRESEADANEDMGSPKIPEHLSDGLAIIDMQMSRIGSPASDLLYCLATSTSLTLRKIRFDDWIKLYHHILIANLVKFGYSEDIFTLEDLYEEINHLWNFALECGIFQAEVNHVFSSLISKM